MNSSSWEKIRIPFFVGILILVFAGGFFLYERLKGGVDLSLKLPDGEVELGVSFDMELALVNNSANALKNVSLELELPENILLVDKPDEKIIFRGIGDMVNGRMHRETFRLVAVPGGNSDYKIKSVVHYVPASISANLQKRKEAEVSVKRPDISLEFSVPERIFSGEKLEARASYRNTLEPKGGNYFLELKINHPPELNDIMRSPEPKGENNSWRLEDIGLREGNVTLMGNLELPDEATFNLTAELVIKILGKEYPIISNTKSVTINPSPLAMRIGLGSAKEVVELGEELTYFLQYKNNANVSLEDVVVTVRLMGEMFDISSLETTGAADLVTNTLVWSPVQIKELEILEPGEEGQVSFSIRVRENYPAGKQNQNSILRVEGRIESPTVPPPLNIGKTVNLSSLETKIGASSSQQ